ncbi:DUF11 domain-containing protein [Ruegeria arenilitoris]|uniref:DUF11 domain-containing protein n=1 Tax=Ruegeria arenilitoris TaxID=1173585 RepID=UPI00148058AF|nr:DUF11 domain-containing protein [Ruegeria arenilitoris]
MSLDITTDEYIDDGTFAVTTDQLDYLPDDWAEITIWNTEVGGTVALQVQHLDAGADGIFNTADDVIDAGPTDDPADDGTGPLGNSADHELIYVTDGGYGDADGIANGIIVYDWYVNPDDSIEEWFLVSAQEVEAGADGIVGTADDVFGDTDTAKFSDNQLSLYSWRNEVNTPNWNTNTTIQSANSIYAENEVIPFRWTSVDGGGSAPQMIEGQTYTIVIDYAFRGTGDNTDKFFMDYLTSYDATEEVDPAFGTGSDLAGFQEDYRIFTWQITQDGEADIQYPTGFSAGFITFYNISSVSFVSYSSDLANTNREDRQLTIEVTVADDLDGTANESVNVGMAFGGHLASELQYGLGNGAGNFPGASPQVVVDLDPATSGGLTDLNINPDAIVPLGAITIVKDAIPDSATDFGFTMTGPDGANILPTFTLDDDADATLENSISFVGLIAGDYTITEDATTGWILDAIGVTETGPADTTADDVYSTDTGSRSATITVADGEIWTVTFQNIEQPAPNFSLDIVKVTYSNDVVPAPTDSDEPGESDNIQVLVQNNDGDQPGSEVTWRYGISLEAGSTDGVPLADLLITDNAGTGTLETIGSSGTSTGDDFNPTFLEVGGVIVGDDGDNILELGETWIAEATDTTPQTGLYINDSRVYASVSVNGATTEDEAFDPSSYTGLIADIGITKSITSVTGTDGDSYADEAGDVIHYQIVVTNDNGVDLTGVSVSDPLLGTLTQTVGDDSDGILNVGESWTYTGTYTLLQSDLDNNGGGDGDIDNTATVSSNELEDESDSAAQPLLYNPGIAIQKYTVLYTNDGFIESEYGGLSGIKPGDEIQWKYYITNTGNVTLENVVLVDDAGTPGDTGDDFLTPLSSGLSIYKVFEGVDTDGDGYAEEDSNKNGMMDEGEHWLTPADDVLDVGETWVLLSDADGSDGDNDRTIVPSSPLVYENIGTVTADPKGTTGSEVTDSDASGYAILDSGYLTDSSFCVFDRDGTTEQREFDVMFTPDVHGGYTNNSTQPGQYFYNVIDDFDNLFGEGSGYGDEPFVLTMHIPDYFKMQVSPFHESQVHVYEFLGVGEGDNGEMCLLFDEEDELTGFKVQFVYYNDHDLLADGINPLDPDGDGVLWTEGSFEHVIVDTDPGTENFGTFDVNIIFDEEFLALNGPIEGNFVANVHLEWEPEDDFDGAQLFNNDATGGEDAVNGPAVGAITDGANVLGSNEVPDLMEHEFYATTGVDGTDIIATSEDSVVNDNYFKKYQAKGIGGFVWDDGADGITPDGTENGGYEWGEGVEGAVVEVYKSGNLVWAGYTDEDGWYKTDQNEWYDAFVHKGKQSDYQVLIYSGEDLDANGNLIGNDSTLAYTYGDDDGFENAKLGRGEKFLWVSLEIGDSDDSDVWT